MSDHSFKERPLEEVVAELEHTTREAQYQWTNYHNLVPFKIAMCDLVPRLIADWRERGEVVRAARRNWSMLADWLDMKYPNDPDPEVQRDLRNLEDAVARYLAFRR